MTRSKLLNEVIQLSPDVVAMEACGGANHWAREYQSRGIQVKLISPQFVKPYVRVNKNDKRDARAIAEACQRPNMNFVSGKTVEQQDMQSLLRIREVYVEMRTKIGNQTRGLLAEYGIVVAKGINKLRAKLPELFDIKAEDGLTAQMKEWFEMQYTLLLTVDEKIDSCGVDIKRLVSQNESCERLQKIEGVGEITSLAIVAHVTLA